MLAVRSGRHLWCWAIVALIVTLLVTQVATAADSPGMQETTERESEATGSLKVLLFLGLLGLCIVLVFVLTKSRLKWLPESIAVIILGIVIGITLRLTGKTVKDVVSFSPEAFFLFLLPPIIFESGYSLHKGNFFRNIGGICIFAIFGTLISTVIVGFLVYLVGLMKISAPLPLLDSLIFGALISAVDPVATLAIFHTLDVDQTLYMLVFGESVLNDAVAVVLFRTLLSFIDEPFGSAPFATMGKVFLLFILTSFGSICLGILSGLFSALLFKHVNFRTTPSLEIALVFIFSYVPYVMSEALQLSGIMSILFCGITMAHYTHFNLSRETQVTTQESFRVFAFVAETVIFVYLGTAVFAFEHDFNIGLVLWSIVFILVGRLANIFPLAWVVNKYRQVKIPIKFQYIMWFSGLRGAIAFALSLTIPMESQRTLVTTTLVIVLFTIIVFGGGTLPLLKFLGISSKDSENFTLSKTADIGTLVDVNDLSHSRLSRGNWFERFDARFLIPFFCIPSEESAATTQIAFLHGHGDDDEDTVELTETTTRA